MAQPLNTSQATSIEWAIADLKAELNQALRMLEDDAESSGHGGSLDDCIEHLKRVTGIFAISNLALPQMLCEELQSSIKDYSQQTGSTAKNTLGILVEAMLELSNLPDNLNRADRLIPQVNNLRALTDRELFTESPAFEINLSGGLKAFNNNSDQPLDSKTIRKLRTVYQRSVLSLIKEGISEQTVAGLQKVFNILYQVGNTAYLSAAGYCGLGLTERIQSDQLDLSLAVKSQFKRLDEMLRKLIAGAEYEDTGLLKNMLFYVAIGANHSERTTRLISIFSLQAYGLDQGGDGSTATLGPELVSKVVEAMQTEIEQAKAWLDDCLHQACELSEAVTQVDAILKRIGDTLIMLNAEAPRAAVQSLQQILDGWKSIESAKDIDAEALDNFANTMVQLEQRLQRLTPSTDDSGETADVAHAKLRILSESRLALTEVKTAVTQCIESNWQWSMLRDVPARLTRVEAALGFYPLEELAKVAGAIRRYVSESLLAKQQPPAQQEIDRFADVIVAIDYYLECTERGTAFHPQFLIAQAMAHCAQLGLAGEQAAESTVAEEAVGEAETDGSAVVDDKRAFSADKLGNRQPEETVSATPTDEPPKQADTSAKAEPEAVTESLATDTTEDEDGDDFEIIGIFIEEAEAILPLAAQHLDEWKNQADKSALLELRRGFHTLKGGGRMIGATAVGELSWAVENMLNRIIDDRVAESAEVHELVAHALKQYPQLLTELSKTGADSENAEIIAIRERAAALSDPGPSAAASKLEPKPEPKPEPELESKPEPSDATSELTDTFVQEAETLRQMIVSIAGAETSGQTAQNTSEQLLKTFHRLADSARTAEFHDLADSLLPFQKILQRYDSINASLASELMALLSTWSGAFDKTLSSLGRGHSYQIEPLHCMAESARALLLRAEKAQQDTPAAARKLRFMPLHQLMAEGLDKVIIAEQLLSDWKMAQLSADDQNQMLDELTKLRSVADSCQVSAITELSQLILETQTEFSAERLLAEDAETWFQQAYAALLAMLDCVASWQLIPKLAEELVSSRPQLEKAAQATIEQAPLDEEFEPVAIEPDTPVSNKKPDFDTDFLDPDDDFQQELLDSFLEEADDLVQEIDASISDWKKDPAAMANADRIHRALHTLKGGARLSGLAKLGDQSHDYESFIIDQQVLQKADGAFFAEALERLDWLHEHIDVIREVRLTAGSIAEAPAPEPAAEPDNTGDATAASLHASSAEQLAPSEPLTEVLPDLQALDSIELDSLADLKTEPVQQPEPEPENPQQAQTQGAEIRRDRQERIRLKAETVEEMVNLSGEATLYRGRIEAQLLGLDSHLDELTTTIDRIQQLARRLDTETEAQIQFRSEQLAEAGQESDFDPLEMDRYSTLQQLSHQLIESASDLQDLTGTVSESSRDANVLLVQSGRIQTELNDHLMRTRMVAFEHIMPRLERIVRQVSRELGKKAELHALDIRGELDRQVLESLVAPIEHILRNAIDHGIESAEHRANANKPESGRITANVHRDGSYMVLTLADDGAGVDFEAVRKRAVERGVVDEERARTMNRDELAEILFTPGFSTTATATQISGRGVGMDVVRSTIREMGGNVTVRSEPGRGAEFSLSIPFTLSVNRALMIHIGDDTYALPLAALEALVRISRSDLQSYYNNPGKKLPYGADEYEFGYLGEVLKTLERPPMEAIVEPTVSLVLFRIGNQRVALLVDEILGNHEVVVKSLSAPFNAVAGLSGAAIMADGSVVVTLDMPTLISSHYESKADLSAPAAISRAIEEQRTPTIMVVDDSVTVRKVTSRLLNRAGFVVHAARDGVEALRLVHESQPDLMLLDVEMPRMDGFELLSVLKSNEQFKHIPVVLITSRTGAKHKQRGLSLGADNYFGKPYREDELLEEINRLLSGARN